MGEDKQRTHCVYSVKLREGKDHDWIKIGLAFPHLDGKGFDITLEALPLNAKLVLRAPAERETPAERENHEGQRLSLAQQVEAFERALIEQCLVETGGKVSAAMDRLGIPRRTLNEKMARLGIDRHRLADAARPNNAAESVKTDDNSPTQ